MTEFLLGRSLRHERRAVLSTFFSRGVQVLVDTLRSDEFQSGMARIGGYHFENSGKILYSGGTS